MLKEEYVIVQCWSWILRIWNPAGESHEGRHSNAALIILETIWSSLPSSLSAPQQFKERKVAGKGTIHVETPGHYLYIWRPFLFSLFLLPGHLLECNEIYPSVKHKAWGLLIGFSSLLEYEITQNASLRLIWSHTALCGFPHKKVSIRDLSQIFTTSPILKQFHYFRQHIWVNICVQFHLYICGTSWLSLKAHDLRHHPRGACFWYICMTPLDLLRTMAKHQQQVFSCPEQLKRWPCHSLAHWFSKVIVDNV